MKNQTHGPQAVGLPRNIGSPALSAHFQAGAWERGAGMSESFLFLGVGGNRFQNPFLLRELSGFQLGINQVAIDRDLEATPARWN
jgi:hypothetical protein